MVAIRWIWKTKIIRDASCIWRYKWYICIFKDKWLYTGDPMYPDDKTFMFIAAVLPGFTWKMRW